MKIRHLTIAGFGPYKNEERIDFDAFAADGIFLITGKTGAGKSSILDAICFALYGAVPRYDSTQSRFRSDHCEVADPSFVTLEFTVNGSDYRVHRTPEYERPKRRGTGTATQPHSAELAVRVGPHWQGLAARPREVALELLRILALTEEQFRQVILLAQNRFQDFLLASNDSRQAVLRSLFGTRRFEQIEATLSERRKAVEAQLGSASQTAQQNTAHAVSLLQFDELPEDVGPAWYDAELAQLTERLSAAEAIAQLTDAAEAKADAEYRVLVGTLGLQRRRNSARESLATLEDEQADIDADRVALHAARRAAPVWPLIGAHESARSALTAAQGREECARQAYTDGAGLLQPHLLQPHLSQPGLSAGPDLSGETLRATIDTIAQLLGTLSDVLSDEEGLPGITTEVECLQAELDTAEVSLERVALRIDSLPQAIAVVAEQAATAKLTAVREEETGKALERITAAQDAARSVPVLHEEHAAALSREAAASAAHAAATVAFNNLQQQRLSGYAAELAAELVESRPCAVCGSRAHPDPAAAGENPVREADVEKAGTSVTHAWKAVEAARGDAQSAGARLMEATTRAGGSSLAELDEERETLRSLLEKSRAAAGELVALGMEQDRLGAEQETARAQLGDARALRDQASEQLAEKRSRRDAIAERIDTKRGDFHTVAKRAAHLEEQRSSAELLATAVEGVGERRRACEDAFRALTVQLVEHGFADAEEAAAARRTPGELDRLEARIREHGEAAAAARVALAESELSDLPEQLVDTLPHREALEKARGSRDHALSEEASLRERCVQFTRLASSVHEQHQAAALLHEHHRQLRELANVVQGLEPNTKRMRLETYVLAAQLEEIVAAANIRLRAMTSGRYALEHDDAVQYRNARSGLGLTIRDEHTGRTRPTHSLSGGETFLASLALALGLAEVVSNQAGGITLDTLFIDEGFGSLDSETLATAMDTLDDLRAGGRTIGLISHVGAMKEQIPAQLTITVASPGHSTIEESFERN